MTGASRATSSRARHALISALSPPWPLAVQPHGPWQILRSNDIYRDPWIEVRCDDVIRPDGREGTHVVVQMKPGVCVVALDEEGFVHLTGEFHYGIGRDSVEGVSGASSRAR